MATNSIVSGVQPRLDIAVTELWNRNDWSSFDTYQSSTSDTSLGKGPSDDYPFSLSTQNHIDVTNFVNDEWVPSAGASAAGYLPTLGDMTVDVNDYPGLMLQLDNDDNQLLTRVWMYTSTPAWIPFGPSTIEPVDFTALDDEDASIVVTLPNFPASVDINNTYLELSSDGFSQTLCALSFANTTSPLSSGNMAATWPLSALVSSNVDPTAVDGIRFRIASTSNSDYVTFAGFRVIGPQWVQTNIDFDNFSGTMRQTTPLDGDTTTEVPSNQDVPIMLRSSGLPGSDDDPRPINAEISVLFNTGGTVAPGPGQPVPETPTNSLSIYMRELTTAFITQIDLLGTSQAALTGQPQPTSGVSEYIPSTLADLQGQSMTDLDQRDMLDLERKPDPVYISWEGFTIQWGESTVITITNSAQASGGEGYTYEGPEAPTLAHRTTYVAIFNITDTTCRLQIFDAMSTGNPSTQYYIGAQVWDSTVIPDVSMFQRHGGRIGFSASLGDGAAWVGPIKPRELMFAEYRSAPLNSTTPVNGCRLYTASTPNKELFSSWSPVEDPTSGFEPILTTDSSKTTSGNGSTLVTFPQVGADTLKQGIVSNVLSYDAFSGITDFYNLEIEFDIWVPSGTLSAQGGVPILSTELQSPTNSFSLLMPVIEPDNWQHVILRPTVMNPVPDSGAYQLIMYYYGLAAGQFWIDSVTVNQRSLSWAARAVADDPWNANPAPWTPFYDNINSDSSGVHLNPRGTQLQVRGQALTQGAAIVSMPKIVPVYAQMGRFIFDENLNSYDQFGNVNGTIVPSLKPTAIITVTPGAGQTYTFSAATSSTDPTQTITNYLWEFSDGTYASGATITHTYPASESPPFSAALTITDTWGRIASAAWSSS